MRQDTGQFRLADYYFLEGLNAFGTTIFFLGIYFHARLQHGFSDTANLLLAATQGGAYVLAARAGGRFADRVGPNRSIPIGLAGMSLALVFGWQSTQDLPLFAAVALYSTSTALTWPALEAAIARAPGRVPLARRAGLYNVTWSFVGSTGFLAGGAIFANDPDAVFWLPLAAHIIQILWFAVRSEALRTTRPAHLGLAPKTGMPVPHPLTAEGRREAGARALFLKSAWIANGLSYFLFGAFAALAPTLGERLGLELRLAIWLVSAYLLARSASFILFWRWEGWEYSRGWLAAALLVPPAAFAAVMFIRSPLAAFGALVVLGALSGLAYSASLHASLDREGGAGEGGGLHEWVIGLGILLGPFAGAAGVRLLGGIAGAGGLVTALGAVAALLGLAPLLRRVRDGR